jgi:hypothetical protein
MYVPIKDLDVWIDFENQTVEFEGISFLSFGQLEVIVENIRLGLVSDGDEDVQ